MTMTTSRLAIALIMATIPACALATPDEDKVLAALRKAHPNTTFTSVSRTPIPGVYEAWMGPNVAFVSSRDTRYVILGRLFDTVQMKDMTATKLAKAEKSHAKDKPGEDAATHSVALDQLPLADALVTVRGNGEHKLAVFSDPGCPYCKTLESELVKLDNVTVYTFLVPFFGAEKPVSIWCASDRQKAWQRYMLNHDASMLKDTAGCEHPIERNRSLAQKLKVIGTPTILLANGARLNRLADAAELQALLTSPPKQTRNTAGEPEKENM